MNAAHRERRCIVTGEISDESALIRFAVDSQGHVVPDVAAKLPGRGAWVHSVREAVTSAAQGGTFGRAFGREVKTSEDLASIVEAQLARRCLDILGLAQKGGGAVAGFGKVRSWIRAGRAAILLHARNGSVRERGRLTSSGGDVSTVTLFDDAELGLALGRESVVHAAVAAGGFAERLRCEASRLAGFRAFNQSEFD